MNLRFPHTGDPAVSIICDPNLNKLQKIIYIRNKITLPNNKYELYLEQFKRTIRSINDI